MAGLLRRLRRRNAKHWVWRCRSRRHKKACFLSWPIHTGPILCRMIKHAFPYPLLATVADHTGASYEARRQLANAVALGALHQRPHRPRLGCRWPAAFDPDALDIVGEEEGLPSGHFDQGCQHERHPFRVGAAGRTAHALLLGQLALLAVEG